MAKISLRAYNREIESLIEVGHLDEAVAHCQHILQTFPMYVETYKLLGKTFLEAKRYADASDIFQRVLMAVPDDFISHVGMSIIRDDEGKLDEAIWHMERAFETQPSNSAIQGELRRLYGKRDGVEPTKIRLSRDALANLYSQGELFNQAIAEIKSVLLGDPNRPDLQVMLSRAYYFAEKNVDAAEMANLLLTKYPYCLDALKVLVEILSSSENMDQVQAYRHRLHLLDPYLAFVSESLFETGKVADSTVDIEKLEYDARSVPGASQPTWASSLGIKIRDENQKGNVPSWVNEMENVDTPINHPDEIRNNDPNTGTIQDSTIDEVSNATPSDATLIENPILDSSNEETLVDAEIPEWLKSKAPQEIRNEDSQESGEKNEPIKEEPLPDWLSDIAGEERGIY